MKPVVSSLVALAIAIAPLTALAKPEAERHEKPAAAKVLKHHKKAVRHDDAEEADKSDSDKPAKAEKSEKASSRKHDKSEKSEPSDKPEVHRVHHVDHAGHKEPKVERNVTVIPASLTSKSAAHAKAPKAAELPKLPSPNAGKPSKGGAEKGARRVRPSKDAKASKSDDGQPERDEESADLVARREGHSSAPGAEREESDADSSSSAEREPPRAKRAEATDERSESGEDDGKRANAKASSSAKKSDAKSKTDGKTDVSSAKSEGKREKSDTTAKSGAADARSRASAQDRAAEDSDADRERDDAETKRRQSATHKIVARSESIERRVRSAKPCHKDPVEVIRGPEIDAFELTTCDGSLAPLAVEHLSILVRPGNADRPTAALTELAKKKGAEIARGIRRVEARLVERLQSIVDHFATPGTPMKVSVISGYRPTSVGSMHATGRAIDFRLEGVKNEDVIAYCRGLADTGCGFYPNSSFVHVDVRDQGTGHVSWIDASGPGETPRYVADWPPPEPPSQPSKREELRAAGLKLDREQAPEIVDEHPVAPAAPAAPR